MMEAGNFIMCIRKSSNIFIIIININIMIIKKIPLYDCVN